MKTRYIKNGSSLKVANEKCTGCGICLDVCPHEVFSLAEGKAVVSDRKACMECGACKMNCPFEAISVNTGVGCAAAIYNSMTGNKDVCCGGPLADDDSSGGGCCGC